MLGRIYQWNHLVLGFSSVGGLGLLFQSPYSIGLFSAVSSWFGLGKLHVGGSPRLIRDVSEGSTESCSFLPFHFSDDNSIRHKNEGHKTCSPEPPHRAQLENRTNTLEAPYANAPLETLALLIPQQSSPCLHGCTVYSDIFKWMKYLSVGPALELFLKVLPNSSASCFFAQYCVCEVQRPGACSWSSFTFH